MTWPFDPHTSHAVMAQRHEPPDSLDDFPTPPPATRALIELVLPRLGVPVTSLGGQSVLEPAVNRGAMAAPLGEYFGSVAGSDIYDYGMGFPVRDFLCRSQDYGRPDWVITNPPFRSAEAFAARALAVATRGVAMLGRLTWIASVGRYRRLWSRHALTAMAPLAERVPILKGRLDQRGSAATDYAWFIWLLDRPAPDAPQLLVIPPSLRSLIRPGDYAVGHAPPLPLLEELSP